VYLLHSKKKWYVSSQGTPQAQFGLDIIIDLYDLHDSYIHIYPPF
jgi:hypothetical protein